MFLRHDTLTNKLLKNTGCGFPVCCAAKMFLHNSYLQVKFLHFTKIYKLYWQPERFYPGLTLTHTAIALELDNYLMFLTSLRASLIIHHPDTR